MTILERLKESWEKCCDLHFECRKWGDGSSAEGVTNIVCDDLGVVIASDVEEAVAESFVALNNNASALLEVVDVVDKMLPEIDDFLFCCDDDRAIWTSYMSRLGDLLDKLEVSDA